MVKPRLRLSSKGWYRYWYRFLDGYANIPSSHRELDIWIGPFSTAEAALRFNPNG